MERCPLCKDVDLATEAERAYQICAACQALLGAEDIPDPRPRVPCRGCGHMELLRASTGDRLLLYRPEVTTARENLMFGRVRVVSVDRSPVQVAALVAYVCRRCSLTELYMPGGERLPAGPQYGTALVDVAPGGEGPFR